nr:radical SAM protein [Ardenticatenales bacterium]
VLGDAEGQWEQVIEDARRGALQRLYRQPGQPSLQGLRFDRRIFAGKPYRPVAPVQYGRGCRFACDFCSIHAFYGFSLRQRPVAEVVAEIEALGRRFILLVDDNLFVDLPRAEELFRALIPLNIRWGCQVSIDVARDEALLALMARSGCVAALIGFESLDEENLRQMKKGWNLKHGDYATAIRRFQAEGIMIYGSFIFGYDHDGPDVFDRIVEFALDSRLFLVNFSALTPTPGSRLYDRLRAEGRLRYERWWLDPTYRYGEATYHPARMSAEELTEGCLRARQAFYGYGSIARRALEPRTNCRSLAHLAVFLGANMISRRELQSKLGRALGSAEPLALPFLPR